jgi:FAD/FMN-containing dehydrogenase
MSHEQFLNELISTLGADVALRGTDTPERSRTDWSGTPPQRRWRWCAHAPRGSQRGHAPVQRPQGCGGAAGRSDRPGRCRGSDGGAVALSLDRMNRIEDIDAKTGLMQVQAGVTLQAVQEAAVDVGMVFGVDLGARGSCQIGGNVSTNAGGNGVLQHGMMREQVLGLEVVLADGTVLPMLRPMIKNNTGYDLKQFFIGAEGTLGIITRVLLRLRPAPQATATTLVAMPDFDSALAVLKRMQSRFGNSVAAYELMWDSFVQASMAWLKLAAPLSSATLAGPDQCGRQGRGAAARRCAAGA